MDHKPANEEEDIRPFVAPCRRLNPCDPFRWVRKGWEDIRRAPRQSLTYGLIMFLMSYAISISAWLYGNLGLYLGLLSGFVFVGPILALTLYDISSRLERGKPVTLLLSMRDAKTQIGNALIYTVVLLIIMLIWLRAATAIHIFFPDNANYDSTELVLFLSIGSVVGSLFCAFIFTTSAFSLPMILDRDTDMITAVVTSVNCVLRNKPTMIVWAMIIVGCVIIGFVTAYIGLIVLLPLLGHATWHSYREAIDPSDWPARFDTS